MSQLRPVIIVLLMLASALAGCTATDTTDLEQQIADLQQSNDEMNETINQQKEDIAGLQSQVDERNTEIATLGSNVAMLQSSIADAETYRDSLLVLLEGSNTSNGELESMIETANNNTILTLQSDLAVQQDLVAEWFDRAINNDFTHVNLSGANLQHARLYYADLRDADLSHADLSHADLHDAQMWNANLSGANLSFANLYYANLYGADLSGANLTNAVMTGADLTNADLTGADLTSAQLSGVSWYNTTCPDGANSFDNGVTCENNL